jgi:putative membrane protein
MSRTAKDYSIVTLKGIAMGAADVIPGVSGGTIAFISGIYGELLDSIKSINLVALKLLLTGKFAEFWKAINGTFLLSLVTGIAFSIISLAKALKYLLDHYPILVWSFFFGLVVASTIYVARTITKWNFGTVASGSAGIIIAYFITVITPAEANTTYWFIFLSGAIAICAMILPGISGSFILVLLGMYKFILEAVGNFELGVIFTFMAGAAIGIISFSNVLSWLLKKYHNLTIALLSGFMIGSLNKVWPWKKVVETFTDRHGEEKPLIEENILPGTYEQITENQSFIIEAIALAAFGFVLIFIIENIANRLRK